MKAFALLVACMHKKDEFLQILNNKFEYSDFNLVRQNFAGKDHWVPENYEKSNYIYKELQRWEYPFTLEMKNHIENYLEQIKANEK